jgi:hypothetical protein
LNKPDTAYAAEGTKGVYKVGLVLGGPEADAFREAVEAAAQAAYTDYFETGKGSEMKAGDRKKWNVFHPFEVDTDDDGNPTGYITFNFRQNAEIVSKDPKTGSIRRKDIAINIFDATGSGTITKPVFAGSVGRIMYSTRQIVIASTKLVGVRLDFAAVQIKDLVTAGARGPIGKGAFGAVDGYVEDAEADDAERSEATGSAGAGGGGSAHSSDDY